MRRASLISHGVIGCVGMAIGASIAPTWRQPAANLRQPTSPPSPGGGSAVVGRGETAALENRLRLIIREELTNRGAAAASPPEEAASRVADTSALPDVAAQSARAHAILDAAITRLSWTSQDAGEFNRAIATLPPAEQQVLLRKFARAVNDQALRLETEGPPF